MLRVATVPDGAIWHTMLCPMAPSVLLQQHSLGANGHLPPGPRLADFRPLGAPDTSHPAQASQPTQ